MAASFQVDATTGFDVIDGSGGTREKVCPPSLPRFIDRILHASSKRLRFSVSPGLKDPDNFERHINSLDDVEAVRFNRWRKNAMLTPCSG
jgi:Cu2+-exporting ATPase